MWIREFLPAQLPDARIFLFGYNANVVFEASTAGVDGQASNLLNRLRAKRQGIAADRPIMFICYSLGGIIVKRALVDAKLDKTYEAIRKLCYGIVFFGTPHRGGNFAPLGPCPENTFIEALHKNSLFSNDMAENFRHQLGDRWVVSFYETLPLRDYGIIVDQKFATLGLPGTIETQLSLDSDHENLCKFHDCDGHDYEQVGDNIKELAEKITTGVCSSEDSEKRIKVLKWLSEIAVEDHHYFISSNRLAGTGDWLFKKPEFIEWEESETSSILWLHGIAGAGKTKLASFVIDKFRRTKRKAHAFAFFYCNYKEDDRKDPESILRSIVKQLSTIKSGSPLPSQILDLYRKREQDGFQLGALKLDESRDLILGFAADFEQTVICIDALDECNKDTRDKLLLALQHILYLSNLHSSTRKIKIFVTSRDDDDIVLKLEGTPNVYIRSSDNASDIAYFVNTEIGKCIQEKKLLRGSVEHELKSKIITALIDGAHGMFLWVHYQIINICKEITAAAIEQALTKLPNGLTETFSEILTRIKSPHQSHNTSTLAQKALNIMLYAQRPLSSNELIGALNIEPMEKGWRHKNGLDGMAIVAICQNLIVIDKGLGVLRFAHLSIQDFLREQFEPLCGHTQLAEICLTLLCWPNYGNGGYEVRNWGGNAFAEYSTSDWANHVRLSGGAVGTTILDEQPLMKLQKEFLRPCQAFEDWCKTQNSGLGAWDSSDSAIRFISPLLVACHFGLLDIFRHLLSTDSDRGALHWGRKTSLHYAAEQGHERIIEELLKKKPAWKVGVLKTKRIITHHSLSYWVNTKDSNGRTPLFLAANEGHEGVVKQLLQVARVDMNCKDYSNWTPLHSAASSGHEEVVKQLLQIARVDVNCKDYSGWAPLSLAAKGGHEGVVKQLLQVARVDANCKDYGDWTPLHSAVSGEYEGVVKQLLQVARVDVNCKDDIGRTPLHFAALGENEGMAKQLLQVARVDVNCKNYNSWTPLHSAVSVGYEGVVKQILQAAGVDLNHRDTCGDTPLRLAQMKRHTGIIKLLYDAGASM